MSWIQNYQFKLLEGSLGGAIGLAMQILLHCAQNEIVGLVGVCRERRYLGKGLTHQVNDVPEARPEKAARISGQRTIRVFLPQHEIVRSIQPTLVKENVSSNVCMYQVAY